MEMKEENAPNTEHLNMLIKISLKSFSKELLTWCKLKGTI